MTEPLLLKRHNHEYRMRVTQEISQRLQEWYGDSLRACGIAGSVAKGEDGPYSDVELMAIIREPVPRSQQFVQDGLIVDLEFTSADNFLKEVAQADHNWAIRTDAYRHRLVLFDKDGIFTKVQELSHKVSDPHFTHAILTQVAVVGEELGKALNALERSDEITFRMNAVGFAERGALLLGLLNRHYYASTRVLFAQATKLPKRPPDLETRLRVLLGVTPATTAETRGVMIQLWNDLVALVEKEGIALEMPWDTLLAPPR